MAIQLIRFEALNMFMHVGGMLMHRTYSVIFVREKLCGVVVHLARRILGNFFSGCTFQFIVDMIMIRFMWSLLFLYCSFISVLFL